MAETKESRRATDEVIAYANELRKWRERRGLTKKALAERMPYDRSYVSHIEGCNLLPTEDFTRRAEEALGAQGALWARWQAHVAAVRGDRQSTVRPSVPARDLRTADFVAWIAEHSTKSFRDVYDSVAELAHRLETASPSDRHERDFVRRHVSRQQMTDAISTYYRHRSSAEVFYRFRVADTDAPILLSVMGRPSWLDSVVQLGTDQEQIGYSEPTQSVSNRLDGNALDAAIHRIASVEATEATVMVNNPIYRLLDITIEPGQLNAAVTTTDFASYALASDLLESELIDALAFRLPAELGAEALPLRRTYLPTLSAAFALDQRVCIGGPLALLAIARGPRRGAPRDYMLLIQERSSSVLNAPGKLSVIPKSFHQPIGAPAEETALSFSLQREVEEELLGRDDLGLLSNDELRRVDPLHAQHVSDPMAWLLERQDKGVYRTECTGFGFNMISGNYEFPCLIVIEDETWWDEFGHLLEANWETARVRRLSSLDTRGLAALTQDPHWSNEGLFAFIQGLRRLSETDSGGRVAAPTITMEI